MFFYNKKQTIYILFLFSISNLYGTLIIISLTGNIWFVDTYIHCMRKLLTETYKENRNIQHLRKNFRNHINSIQDHLCFSPEIDVYIVCFQIVFAHILRKGNNKSKKNEVTTK